MKTVYRNAVLIALALFAVLACKRDELDFDKLANRIQNERNIAIPLVLGDFSIREFVETDDDSVLVINGDTVSLFIREDSIITYSVSDFAEIPEQGSTDYVSSPESDIPVTGVSVIDTTGLEIDTLYNMTLENSMRIDSVFLNNGQLTFNINNTFNHRISLIFSSASLKDVNGNLFSTILPDIPPRSQLNYTLDINNYTIITFQKPDLTRALHLNFHPIVYNDENQDYIQASNSLQIEFGFGNINDFNAAFGFFGFQTDAYDTILTDLLPDMLEGLEGTFSVSNPKINLLYDQSFGLGAAFDLYMEAYYPDKNDVIIDPPAGNIYYSTDYLNPMYNGKISWNKTSIPNIDSLISFPFPESLLLRGDIAVNQGEDSLTHLNYALWESMLNLGLEIEIPLEFSADLTYRDTIEFEGISDENTMIEVEYANLEYWFENYFPLGFDADLILYDSISKINLDTIKLNTDPANMFLDPAPVDAQGNVVESQVTKHVGVMALDKSTAESLLNEATHFIVEAHLITTNTNSARIGAEAKLNFQFSLDANLTITSY